MTFDMRKRKIPASLKVLLVIFMVAGLCLAGVSCAKTASNDLNQKVQRSVSELAAVLFQPGGAYSKTSSTGRNLYLQHLVSELVEKNASIDNCVLAVAKGDGSFAWMGAAGIANQDGQVPMTKDTPIYIASITKLFTATVIMRLYEERALALDDPISKYLPADLIRGIQIYQGKDYSHAITIKQLLSHSSGIADYYTEKSKKQGKSLFEVFLEDPARTWTVEDTIAWTRDELEAHFAPGTDGYYSDTNYQLLGKIIEKVTQKPLPIVYQDFIFRPLRLNNTWLIVRSQPLVAPSAATAEISYKDKNVTKIRSNGSYWADGGLVSTAGDMIVFLKALNEGKIISRDTLKLMHDWHKLEFPLQYGYGTMYFQLPRFMNHWTGLTPLWGHSGSSGSFLYYSEALNLYMAGSINSVDSDAQPFLLMRSVMKLFNSKG